MDSVRISQILAECQNGLECTVNLESGPLLIQKHTLPSAPLKITIFLSKVTCSYLVVMAQDETDHCNLMERFHKSDHESVKDRIRIISAGDMECTFCMETEQPWRSFELRLVRQSDDTVCDMVTLEWGSKAEQTASEVMIKDDQQPLLDLNIALPRVTRLLHDFDMKDDGPAFRAAIHELEVGAEAVKRDFKRLIKAFEAVLASSEAKTASESALLTTLAELEAFEPSLPYLSKAGSKLMAERERANENLKTQLLDPLIFLYEHRMKALETRKREYEAASETFYSYTTRYLGKNIASDAKREAQREAKHRSRQAQFELIRFEYWSFLQDLQLDACHRALALLVGHLHEQARQAKRMSQIFADFSPDLDALRVAIEHAAKDVGGRMEERQGRGQALIQKYNQTLSRMRGDLTDTEDPPAADLSTVISPGSRGSAAAGGAVSPTLTAPQSPQMNPLPSNQPISKYLEDLRRSKEGFLYIERGLAERLKPFWCVLSSGRIYEYSLGKDRLPKLSNVQVLENCTVRAERDTDRRFTFEVISPNAPTRIYQATSEVERAQWIQVIQNAIVSWIDGRIEWEETGVPRGSLGALDLVDSSNTASAFNAIPSTPPEGLVILADIWSVEALQRCSDCHRSNPDWCSINLGVMLCIECSGIHRSLGSHVSKVRSVTLDVSAFTGDLIEQLKLCDNGKGLEELLDQHPEYLPHPHQASEHATKERFIRAKYIEKLFKRPLVQ